MLAQLVQRVPRVRLVLPDQPDLQARKVRRARRVCLEVAVHRDFKGSKEYRDFKVQLVPREQRVQLVLLVQLDLLKFQSEQLFLDKRFKEELGRRCPQVLSGHFLLEKNILFI